MRVSVSTFIAFFLNAGISNAFIITKTTTTTTSINSSTSLSAISPRDIPHTPSSSSEPTFLIQQQSPKSFNTQLSNIQSQLTEGITNYLLVPPASAASDTPSPPTKGEVKLLRDAFSALYGERNPDKAEGLLTDAIAAWERQNPDEKAALYRVRGDCFMELLKPIEAEKDYTIAINYLKGPGGDLADPSELPSALLGRARTMRSMANSPSTSAYSTIYTPSQYKDIANDYRVSLRLSSREEWDTDDENEADGATRNPYAAWEWGMARRGSGDMNGAAETHTLASIAFKEIGDRAHSVISALDAGIDLAGTDNLQEAKKVLESAIQSTTSVEGRDVELLQRVIAKEGEARMALASILWSNNEKAAAEMQFGEASGRLDQLQADADAREAARVKSGAMPPLKIRKLPFTIDDTAGPELSCSRFKNEKFVRDTLLWPEPLQQKMSSLNNLKK